MEFKPAASLTEQIADHLTGEIVNMKLGLRALHVPYKGSAPALTDLIGGQIDLMYDALALPAIKNGQAKALAATSRRRHPELPDIPTMRELGYEIDSYNWYGIFAPDGTPRAIVERVSAEIGRIQLSTLPPRPGASFRPSAAESTETAGVMMPSP